MKRFKIISCNQCPFFYIIEKERKVWVEHSELYIQCYCSIKKREVERENPEWCPLFKDKIEVFR